MDPRKRLFVLVAVAVGVLVVVGLVVYGLMARDSTDKATGPESASEHPAAKPYVPTTSPDYIPPRTRDPALGPFVDRRSKERVPVDITSRMPRIKRRGDIPVVASVLMDREDDDTVRNEAANLLRRSGYTRLTDDLIRVLNDPDEGPRFRSFAAQHLWQNARSAGVEERTKIVTRLREALADQDIPVRREALLALARLGDERGKESTIAWLGDGAAVGLHDAAIRCAKELDLREQIPTIRKYVRDSDEVVQIAAIVTLSQWGDEESRAAFEEAVKSGSVRLQRAGKAALKRLDGAKEEQ